MLDSTEAKLNSWKGMWAIICVCDFSVLNLNLNLNGIRRKEANSGYYIRRGCVRMLLSV